jgi:endogenous inhibitor of DNA gyrase (YacG/DUF329 family)
VDDIKLKECDGCDLVKYCGDKCMEEHREQHDEECKTRKAELRDKELFRPSELHDKKLFNQPDGSHLGECPLCFLPMPLGSEQSRFYPCCSQLVCDGCVYAHHKRNGGRSCPFCREPVADDEENDKRLMKRVKANDPAALRQMGSICLEEGDHDVAVEYWTKAAELGDPEAHYQLGDSYHQGDGVEKDEEKAIYHMEKAAMGGDPDARHILGCIEHENGNFDRSVKHFIIAANNGNEDSMNALWKYYSEGNITKEDLDATLRTHHAAINEMKSPEREAAEAWRQRQRGCMK